MSIFYFPDAPGKNNKSFILKNNPHCASYCEECKSPGTTIIYGIGNGLQFHVELTNEGAIYNKFKKLNPNLEVPLENALDLVKNCFSTGAHELPDRHGNLHMSTTIEGVDILWKFEGREASLSFVNYHIMVPQSLALFEMLRRQKVLMTQLQLSEMEIQRLCLEHGVTRASKRKSDEFVNLETFHDAVSSKDDDVTAPISDMDEAILRNLTAFCHNRREKRAASQRLSSSPGSDSAARFSGTGARASNSPLKPPTAIDEEAAIKARAEALKQKLEREKAKPKKKRLL